MEMFNELACALCSARTSSHPLCYFVFFVNDLGDMRRRSQAFIFAENTNAHLIVNTIFIKTVYNNCLESHNSKSRV